MADGTVTIKINVDGKDIEVELGKVKTQVEDTGETAVEVSDSAQRNAAAVGVAIAAIATSLVAAGLKAYEFSSQFQAAFAKTQTIMDTNVMAAEDMRSAVLRLSRDSAMAAGDVSEAVYQAISGSVDTADAVAFVDKANQLAVAGFTSLTNATDVLTTTLNAYHLGAEKVNGISNVLIQTQNLGKTSVDELAASMGKSIATGSAYGVDLQNLSTAYVELTRNGIATAESTTYINSMLNELGDSGKTVGKILQERTGKSFGQLMQDGASLGDVLGILLDSVDGNTEAFMGLWGSQEAGKAANAIASQSIADFNKVLGQMNAEMSGTTGTTEQAYETMTSTSEFIDKRLTNSVHNLAIAYGDILAPPLDAIKSLGADILDGITELIRSSPFAAAAISAISTGVVVFVGALSAYVIVSKAAKIAQDALNSSVMTNPYLLAAAAVGALVAGIGTLIPSLNDGHSAAKKFQDSIAELESSREESIASVQATANVAQHYIDRLKEMEEAGIETTEQQREYHNILVLLTETVPELAGLIDLETDTIKGGTDALEANTEAWRKNALQQAFNEYLAGVYKEQADAMIQAELASVKLTKARTAEAMAKEKYMAVQEQINALEEEAIAAAKEAYGLDWEMALPAYRDPGMEDLQLQADELYQAWQTADSAAYEAQETYDDYAATAEIAKGAIDEAQEAVDSLTNSLMDNGSAAGEAATGIDIAGDRVQAATEKVDLLKAAVKEKTPEITESIQAWADKYGELYKAAKESLEKQFKLWEEAERVTAVSVGEANKGIQSQIDYWHRYNDDLTTIKDSNIAGLDQLYKYISDGSTDSVSMAAGIADAIRSGNEPAVEEMVELYKGLTEAQGETAESMLSMQTDMDQALNELVSAVDTAVGDMELPDAAWDAAHETVLAYARGLYSGQASAERAARSVASAAQRALSGKTTIKGSSGVTATPYASGTSYADAGLALVGEEGPELIWLRGGERILTADETRDALSGMYPLLDSASYTGSVAPAAVGGGPTGAQQMTIVVPVEIDGRELARVTAQAMGEEMMFSAY
jgi:TP901 family phage tail tape measure protein